MRFDAKYRWLPTPYRSVMLFVVWLLLNQSIEAVHLFFGVVLVCRAPIIVHACAGGPGACARTSMSCDSLDNFFL